MFTSRQKRRLRGALAAALAVGLAILGAGSALALEVRGSDIVTIGPNEIVADDMLVGASRVVVDGTIEGDLIVGATEVIINGTVKGSLAAGAQLVTINGTVDGTVYTGAAALNLGPEASVGRNLLFGGYSLRTDNGSAVGRDVLMGGYQAILGGEVGRDVRAGLGALELNGAVGGDVVVDVGAPDVGAPDAGAPDFGPVFMTPGMPAAIAPGLRVGPAARIDGQIIYTSDVPQSTAIEAQPEGGVVYQTPVPGEELEAAPAPAGGLSIDIFGWMLDRAREFTTLLVLGLLALWLLPNTFLATTEKARTQPLPAMGWGLLVVVAGFAAAALLGGVITALGVLFWVVTLGGLSGTIFGVGYSGLGLGLTLFMLLISYGSKLVVAHMLGSVLTRSLFPQYTSSRIVPLAGGVVVYVILRGIPLVGWLFGLIATLIGLGAVWLLIRERRTAQVAPAPLAAPAA